MFCDATYKINNDTLSFLIMLSFKFVSLAFFIKNASSFSYTNHKSDDLCNILRHSDLVAGFFKQRHSVLKVKDVHCEDVKLN